MTEPNNIVSATSSLGRAIITALPPAFLVLILINFALFWLVLSAVESQADQRLSILKSVIERCLDRPPGALPRP